MKECCFKNFWPAGGRSCIYHSEGAAPERASRLAILALTSLLVSFLTVLAGCSSGNSGTGAAGTWPTSADLGPGEFLAADFSAQEPKPYIVKAGKAGEGVYCILYLEQGRSVSQAQINAIIREFDETIYPGVTETFGSEPNPGIDADQKIHILLLDIRDGFNGTTQSAYIAGYFDPGNEYPAVTYPYSNEKELIYMDIYPAVPASARFYNTLAHEFQHMIHWEQKDNRYGISDETWLDEAMSEIAPVYCGYGPSYSRVYTFQTTPSDSLTRWDGTLNDYAVAYMWAHYIKDRFESSSPNIFRIILQNNRTGIEAVNAALALAQPPVTFTAVFKDWAIANYSGNSIAWPDHPEWSYTSLDTRPGTYNQIKLPGLFPASRENVTSLPALPLWSTGYYSYTPLSAATGTITWTASGSAESSSLADPTPSIHPGLVSGQAYTFATKGYLIRDNAGDLNSLTGASVTRSSVESDISPPAEPYIEKRVHPAKTPKALVDQANADHRMHAAGAGDGPEPVCVHSFFAEKRKGLRAKGAKPDFN